MRPKYSDFVGVFTFGRCSHEHECFRGCLALVLELRSAAGGDFKTARIRRPCHARIDGGRVLLHIRTYALFVGPSFGNLRRPNTY
jgi:hypothetical protein